MWEGAFILIFVIKYVMWEEERRIHLIFVEITKRLMEHKVMKPKINIKQKPSTK
jgi:hypothetical protein